MGFIKLIVKIKSFIFKTILSSNKPTFAKRLNLDNLFYSWEMAK